MTPSGLLTGIGVLVTRPKEQATRLMTRLRDLQAAPFLFPALAIQASAHSQDLLTLPARVDQYDLHLFVSPTAVQFGLAVLPSGDATRLHAAAIGNGTAAALRAGGAENILAPIGGADSEHLLALPQLAELAGKRVLIFRGEGGRELIADTLRARGAEVDYAECYRRVCPQTDPTPLLHEFELHRIQAITVFSSETLDNLLHLLGVDGARYARALPLFVPHVRIAEHAQAQKFAQVITTAPGEDGVLAGLVEYFGHD